MKKTLVLLLLAITLVNCSTNKKATATNSVNVPKYINSITAEELRTHLTIVASDEMEGRNTGSEGQKKAGRYLIKHYQDNGIPFPKGASDYYQKVPSEFMKKGFSPKLND